VISSFRFVNNCGLESARNAGTSVLEKVCPERRPGKDVPGKSVLKGVLGKASWEKCPEKCPRKSVLGNLCPGKSVLGRKLSPVGLGREGLGRSLGGHFLAMVLSPILAPIADPLLTPS
jgi:hypothetical protein